MTVAGADQEIQVARWRHWTANIVSLATIAVIIAGVNLGIAGYSWLWVLALGAAWLPTFFLRIYLLQTDYWRNTFPALPVHHKLGVTGILAGVLALVAAIPFAGGRLFSAF